MLIDSHCHLDFSVFDGDRAQVLTRAITAGVAAYVVPATTAASFEKVLTLSRESIQVYAALGLHPYFMSEHDDEALTALRNALNNTPGVVAVGECGFDARLPDPQRQWQLFDAQLALAREFSLPVIVHCVRANDQVAKHLREACLPRGGIIHAFAGSEVQAERFLALGFVLGLGGSVTYSRAQKLRHVVSRLPDEGFILETDSPDMPLSGYQGQRNEPVRVKQVAEVVAELRATSVQHIGELTTANVRRVLQLNV
ncbi:TatD family deoxyribonuclease [Cobetia crustatorum]|uniref:TatD family deoxyribonuclease n=2 Tax=Halomonadaceae TaxID=28256 RepID=A0A558HEF9_9GAMM|nr:TatD family deoxyribonuclease [Cobetia crustatorum]